MPSVGICERLGVRRLGVRDGGEVAFTRVMISRNRQKANMIPNSILKGLWDLQLRL